MGKVPRQMKSQKSCFTGLSKKTVKTALQDLQRANRLFTWLNQNILAQFVLFRK